MSSVDYVSDAIKNLECKLADAYQQLCMNISTLISARYRPELETTRLFSDDHANYFQNLI
jgi:hypothetical protein